MWGPIKGSSPGVARACRPSNIEHKVPELIHPPEQGNKGNLTIAKGRRILWRMVTNGSIMEDIEDSDCESNGESSDDSDMEKLQRVLSKKPRASSMTLPPSSNTSSTSSSDESAFPVKKRRMSKNEARRTHVASKGIPGDVVLPSKTAMPHPNANQKEPAEVSSIKDEKDHDSQESEFEDLISFWNNVDEDILMNSNVEGIQVDDLPQDRVVTKDGTDLTREAGRFPNEPAPDPNVVRQARENFHNPYQTTKNRGGNGATKLQATPSSGNHNSNSKIDSLTRVGQTTSSSSTAVTTVPMKEQATRELKKSEDEATGEESGGDWLERLLETELAAVEREIGQLPTDEPIPENSMSPTELNEETIAQAFGFDNPATQSSSGNSNCPSQRISGDDNLRHTPTPGIERETRTPEVHPDLYAPPTPEQRSEPIVHYFAEVNRPKLQRQRVPVNQIFDQYRSIASFFKFGSFNHLQSEVANTLAFSDDNVVLSAPTGAGKTAIFEMAMARFFSVDLQQNGGNVTNNRKVIYVAPNKALCEQRVEDWS